MRTRTLVFVARRCCLPVAAELQNVVGGSAYPRQLFLSLLGEMRFREQRTWRRVSPMTFPQ